MTILNVEISQIDNLFNVITYGNDGIGTSSDVKVFTTLDAAKEYATEVMNNND